MQTDKALARLLGQPEEYKDYARLWNEQRGHSIWENEDFTKRQSAAKMHSSNKKDDAAKVNTLPLHHLTLAKSHLKNVAAAWAWVEATFFFMVQTVRESRSL